MGHRLSPSTSAARYTPADAIATGTSSPPADGQAQPGAPVVPQPTNAAAVQQNHTPIPTPTPTSSLPFPSNPPAPQPGAVSIPNRSHHQRNHSMPLSPRSVASISQTYSPAPLLPHQTGSYLTTPTRSVPPASVTSPVAYNYTDLSHPPGYMQDSRASFEDRPFLSEQNESASQSPFSLSRAGSQKRPPAGAGILNGEMWNTPGQNGEGVYAGEEKGVWDTAAAWGKQAGDWAKEAGKRLSRTEEEIWRRVNGKN
jgi:hypothetical protein